MMRIRVLVSGEDGQVDAAEAVKRHARFSSQSSGLSIEVDAVEHLAGLWNLGRLDLLGRQLADAASRLAKGKPGIVRSAVLDARDVPFHLFEPPEKRGGEAHISRFFMLDREREGWFPLPGWGHEDPEELFAYVEANRDELLRPERSHGLEKPPMLRVPAPIGELKKQLKAAAVTAEAAFAYATSQEDT